MKYFAVILAFMVLMSFSLVYAMVEMYRIEMNSHDTRIIAFYDTYFKYMTDETNAAMQENMIAEQIQNIDQDVIV